MSDNYEPVLSDEQIDTHAYDFCDEVAWDINDNERYIFTPDDWREFARAIASAAVEAYQQRYGGHARIVACMNACEGLATESLELIASSERVGRKLIAISLAEQQSKELLEALKTIASQEHRFLGRAKHEQCAHGRYSHEDCDSCASDYAKAAIAAAGGAV